MEVYLCYELTVDGKNYLIKIVDSREKAQEWLTEIPLKYENSVKVFVPSLVE